METKTWKVVGGQTMHCSGCETSVKFVLHQVPGIEAVDANYKTQLVEVAFDPQTVSLDRVKEELDWIGYTVEEAADA